MSTEIRLDEILIEGRHRHDLGNITELADSIDRLGLLHPIVVTPELRLVAGERRLAACRELGWDEVPVTVADNLADAVDLLQAERDENTCRKAFTPSEAARIAMTIEDALRPVARERQGKRTDLTSGQTLPEVPSTPPPRPRDIAAKSTGYSHETLRKVREVEKIAEAPETPEPVRRVAQDAIKTMDATGKVDGPHHTVKAAEIAVATKTITEAIDQRNPDAAAERAAAALRSEYSKAMTGVTRLPNLDSAAVAAVISDAEAGLLIGVIKNSLLPWAERVQTARKPGGLRLVKDA